MNDKARPLRLEVRPDRATVGDVPSVFVNYAEVFVGQEETCLVLYLRQDQTAEVRDGKVVVAAKPVQTLIMTTAHARRLVEALAGQLDQVPEEQTDPIP